MIIKNIIPVRYIFNEIKFSLLTVAIIGIVVDTLPYFFTDFLPDIPIAIATTLGIAISILLSFKVNQSYDRWWEARKIWGAIVNDSRTLILQLQMYVPEQHPLITTMAHRQIAWCYALGQALRKQEILPSIEHLLSKEELEELKEHQNIPLKIISQQVDDVKTLNNTNQLDNFSRLQIEETLTRLTASMGKCERIKNTFFPSNYRKGLHVAIYLFVIFLSSSTPLRLPILLEVLILVLVSMVFFFLEKAAYRLQDPFENLPTDTPVTSISRTIDINIRQLLGEKELPKPIKSQDFYVM